MVYQSLMGLRLRHPMLSLARVLLPVYFQASSSAPLLSPLSYGVRIDGDVVAAETTRKTIPIQNIFPQPTS
jgi:hypothetical protein